MVTWQLRCKHGLDLEPSIFLGKVSCEVPLVHEPLLVAHFFLGRRRTGSVWTICGGRRGNALRAGEVESQGDENEDYDTHDAMQRPTREREREI